MKQLVSHLLKNNYEEIIKRSLLNCHIEGMHSIMLLESPGKTIRLYIAEPGNGLHMNKIHVNRPAGKLSIGFHAHHCNLTLHVIKGTMHNWTVESCSAEEKDFSIQRYLHKSHIIKGEIGFDYIGPAHLKTKNYSVLNEGDSIHLSAKDVHTVYTEKDKTTAWLVYEGNEDADYEPYMYSNGDLFSIDSSNLYQPMTEDKLTSLLHDAGLC